MTSTTQPFWQTKLDQQLNLALQTGNFAPLEFLLITLEGDADPHQHTALIRTFANTIGQLVTSTNPPVEQLEILLDGWASLPLSAMEKSQAPLLLPGLAIASYGRVAEVRPDWWSDEIRKLHLAATHPLPQVRAEVINAFQHLLLSDQKERTSQTLQNWLSENNPLVVEVARNSLATT